MGVAARRVYLELNGETITLEQLGLQPRMSFFYQGVKITKTKGFGPINLGAKWQKNSHNKKAKEPWFIMTSLPSLCDFSARKAVAIKAYSQRMGIEEMFRDFKKRCVDGFARRVPGRVPRPRVGKAARRVRAPRQVVTI